MVGSCFYKAVDSLNAVELMLPSHDHFFWSSRFLSLWSSGGVQQEKVMISAVTGPLHRNANS